MRQGHSAETAESLRVDDASGTPPSDAELDALPEYILDERRSILWQLCDDGQYSMLATGDPVALDPLVLKSLDELRATVGSVLVPLVTDDRERDARTGLTLDSARAIGRPIDRQTEREGNATDAECPMTVIRDLTQWTIDQGRPQWAQMLKVSEESGEAAQAYLRHIAQPPSDDPWDGQDVVYELADTAIAALVAIQRINHWDAEMVLNARLDALRQRFLADERDRSASLRRV